MTVSIHAESSQVNPISGLGGNNGILSAAHLANEIADTARYGRNPDQASLEKAFYKYQHGRDATAREVVKLSHEMQLLDTLDNWVIKFVRVNFMRYMTNEYLMNTVGFGITPSVRLKHLPLPSKRRLVLFNDQVTIQPRTRSVLVSWLWILLLFIVVMALYPLRHIDVVNPEKRQTVGQRLLGWDASKAAHFYYHMSLTTFTGILCIESHRKHFAFLNILGR